MTQLYTVCGARPINNQIILFNGHNRHFDEFSLHYLEYQKMHHSILKSDDFGNDYPNENGPNANLNYFYNYIKASWMFKCGTTKNHLDK